MDERKLTVRYDEKNDLLNVTVGNTEEAVIVRMEDNFYLKMSVKSGEIVGYTITRYSENVHRNREWSDKLLTVPDQMGSGAFFMRRERPTIKKAA
jgi:uncharacterized protein YuzE